MFARTKDAIEVHLTIVFTALAVAREAQNRTGLSIRNLVRQLRALRSATIAVNGAVQTVQPASTLSSKPSSTPSNGAELTHWANGQTQATVEQVLGRPPLGYAHWVSEHAIGFA